MHIKGGPVPRPQPEGSSLRLCPFDPTRALPKATCWIQGSGTVLLVARVLQVAAASAVLPTILLQ